MAERAKDPKKSIGDPPSRKTEHTKKGKTTIPGEGAGANDPPDKPGGDEETMPIEEGFSIVP